MSKEYVIIQCFGIASIALTFIGSILIEKHSAIIVRAVELRILANCLISMIAGEIAYQAAVDRDPEALKIYVQLYKNPIWGFFHGDKNA